MAEAGNREEARGFASLYERSSVANRVRSRWGDEALACQVGCRRVQRRTGRAGRVAPLGLWLLALVVACRPDARSGPQVPA